MEYFFDGQHNFNGLGFIHDARALAFGLLGILIPALVAYFNPPNASFTRNQ